MFQITDQTGDIVTVAMRDEEGRRVPGDYVELMIEAERDPHPPAILHNDQEYRVSIVWLTAQQCRYLAEALIGRAVEIEHRDDGANQATRLAEVRAELDAHTLAACDIIERAARS